MPILDFLIRRISALSQHLRRLFAREPTPPVRELDLHFLEDRILYSGVALASELLAAQCTGIADGDFATDAASLTEFSNPDALAVWGGSDPSQGPSDSIAQIEVSLQELDKLLAELRSQETAQESDNGVPVDIWDTLSEPFQFALIPNPDLSFDGLSEERLQDAFTAASEYLKQLVESDDPYETLQSIFQRGVTESEGFEVRAHAILEQIRTGGLGIEVELLSDFEMRNAVGAYAAIGHTGTERIYLNGSLIAAGLDIERLTNALLEEFGHALDARLNPGEDGRGDEGELFAAVVMGRNVSQEEREAIIAEDDHGFIAIDGVAVAVERSGPTLNGWQYRQQLVFSNASRAENLDDFPILVSINTTTFGSSFYSQAKANGADLRFLDGNGSSLAYEIQTWNTSGTSLVWVKVPRIDASSNSDSIFAFWGNASASDSQNAASVWSNGYVGVWHMEQTNGSANSILDSTSYANHGTPVGIGSSNVVSTGAVGNAINFVNTWGGQGFELDYITLPSINGDELTPQSLTLEAWAWRNYTDDGNDWRNIIARTSSGAGDSFTLSADGWSPNGPNAVTFWGTGTATASNALALQQWRYLAASRDTTGGNIYSDGSNVATLGGGNLNYNDPNVLIGAQWNGGSTPDQAWTGYIDEVRISNVKRSANWISAQYASMTGSLITYAGVTNVNQYSVGPVSDTNAASNNIAENAASGTTVGITAYAVDQDTTNNTITYTLDDNAGGRFAINASTGVVTVSNGSLLNFESASSHTITVRATSADSSFSTANFTISLTDVDEFDVGAISDTNAAANSLAENSANGTAVGITASASDADGSNNTITYSLDDSAGGRFAITNSTGVITVANSSLLNFESATSHAITVRASSSDGSFSTANFTITLTDVDEFDVGAISDTNASANSIAENSANGTAVGITASASDADGSNNTITYSLDDSAGGRFAINSSTGIVTVANSTLLNFEAGTSHTITVRATSSDGSFSTANYTISLTDVDEFDVGAISDTNAAANSLAENSANGTAVGITASASDADGSNNTITYSLDNTAGGRFAINSSTGVVTVANSSLLDFESATSHTITVRASSSDGSFSTANFTISLTNVNETPSAVADTATAVEAGGVSNGTAGTNPTGNVLTNDTDVDAGDTKTVTGVAAGTVGSASTNVGSNVTGTYGTINIGSTGAFTYTVDNSNATVQALRTTANTLTDVFTYTMRDAAGLTSTTQITITIQGANDAPHDLSGTLTVAENSANGSSVGTITRSDVDSGDGASYSLVDSAGGRFAINSSTGVVTVANSSLLNREAAASHNITVRVTDTAGATYDEVFTVTVTDVDEFDVGAISDTNAAANSIAENSANGTAVGITASASDADATNNTITYSLDNNAGGRFAINSSTGVVTVANSTLLNFEAGTSHTITVRATSSDGSASTANYTVSVTDVDEFDVGAISDTNAAANSVAENSANGTAVGITASASDADGSNNTITYSLDNTAGGRFTINSSTGVVTVANSTLLNFEAATSHTITVRASSSDGSASTANFTISLTNVNETPSAVADAATAVEAGGVSNGTAGTNPTGNVLTNDTDVDASDTKTVTGVSAGVQPLGASPVSTPITGSYGSITIAANGAYTYTVDNSNATVQALRTTANTLTDVFTYTMRDAAGLTSTTQITVTIQGANDNPVGVNDTATTVEAGGLANGTAGTNPTGNVLTNDTDVDTGDTKTVNGVVAGAQAAATGNVGASVVGTYGSINIAADGSYTYTVDNSNATIQALRTTANTLSDVFTYRVVDTGGLTSLATVTITIQGANDAPVGVNDTATAAEAGGLANGTAGVNPTGNVLTNDTDVDSSANGETKTVTAVSAGSSANPTGAVASSITGIYGSISIAADGSYTYTVDNSNATVQALRLSSQTLSETFTYRMADAGGLTSLATVTITIQGANDNPVGVNDTATATEAGGITNGTVGVNPTGNVLTNDTDVDTGDTKTVNGVVAGAQAAATGNVGASVVGTYGSINIAADGSYTYTVDNNNSAVQALRTTANTLSDVFTYRVVDTGGLTSLATVTITIQGSNDNPVGVNDTATATEAGGIANGTAGVNPTGNVLTNDTDVDAGDTKTVNGVVAGAQAVATGNVGASVVGTYGSINIAADGSYTYTVDNNNSAVQALRTTANTLSDVFTYRVVDTGGLTSLATVTITIQGANDNPVGVNDTATAVEAGGLANGTVGVNPTGNVLTNDTDVDTGDTKTVNGIVAGAQATATGNVGLAVTGTYGSINIAADGSYTYTVDNNNSAVQALRTTANTLSDVFTYRVVDTGGLTSLATVTITIQGSNDNPVAVADTGIAVEAGGVSNGTAGSNATGNVITNDTDVDSTANGETRVVSGVAAGSVGSAAGSVGSSVTGTYGSISIGSNGAFTYTVDNSNSAVQALRLAGQTLSDVFTYTITDAGGLTSTTQVTITIQGANDNPVGVNDTATAVEAGGLANGTVGVNPTGNVLTNDTDVDTGDTKTVNGIVAGAQAAATGNVGASVVGTYGSINIAADGSYTYTVDNNNSAVQALRTTANTLSDVFTYRVVDTGGLTSLATVTITIQGSNDNPVGVNDTATATEAGGIANGTVGVNPTGNVLTNDTDVDTGDTKTINGVVAGAQAAATGNVGIVVTGTYGSINIAADGSYTYTVDNNNSAVQALRTTANTLSDVFTYRVVDTGGLTSLATVTITIQGSNDNPVGVNDTATATEAGGTANGTAGVNPTGNVLTNDTDVDTGDTKTVNGVVAGAQAAANGNVGASVVGTYGSINIAADGSYTYTVENNNSAVQALRTTANTLSDVFTYRVVDTGGLTSLATVTVTIQGANDNPVGVNDTATAVEAGGLANGTVGVNPTGNVLTNDTDVDTGDTKTVNGIVAGAQAAATGNVGASVVGTYGSINIAADGSYTYTVDNNNSAVQALRTTANTLSDVFTYRLVDTGGLTSLATVTISIQGSNDNPVGVNDTATATEAGGLANGTVGVNPTGNVLTNDTDVDTGDTKTVNGVVAGAQAVATGNVGIVVTGTYGSINIAADGSYTYTVDNTNATVQALLATANTLSDVFTYRVVDTGGLTSLATITVTIQGANDAPHDLSGTLTVAENSANGSSVGTITRSDVDSGDGASYSLVDSAGGRFAINSSTGVVTVANSSLPDRESAASHNITVRVTDTAGATYDEVFTVTVTDVDEFDVGAISDTNASANSIAENSANGTAVGITASASDADATNNTITYSLDDSAGGRFAINGSTGIVTVANSTLLNFEAGTSHAITVRATSSDGSFSTANYTISVTDVDEFDVGAISDTNAAANSLAENSANGTAVGITASASDADGSNNTITYSLDNTAGGRFTINSSTGVVTVANSSLLDFESATSHTITVRASSTDGSFSTANFTISLTNVNETPSALADTATAVEAGGVSNGTAGTNPTGNVLTNDTDVDASDTKTVTGVSAGVQPLGASPVSTPITGTYGTINIASNGAFTYTVDNSNATVQALRTTANTLTDVFTYTMRDTAGLTSTTQITVTIQGANDAPHDLSGTLTVAENSANGSSVGTITRSDVDSGDGASYSLVDSAGGRFAINSSTGVVTVANSSLLDRESAASHNITVRVTDTAGATYDEVFTVTVTDVDEFDVGAISDTSASANSIAENSANGTAVGITASASDADATNNTITYSLDNNASGRFAINSSTGVVTVADSALLNFESATSHAITVRATSSDGSFSTVNYTVSVTDVDEFDVGAISDTNAAANSLAENSANGTAVGITASASDADGSNNTITYSLDNTAGGRFTINSSTGVVTVANSSLLDFESATSHTITVRATSSDGSFSAANFTISLTDVDEFDVGAISDTNAAANSLAENSANGTAVGITASASDADGTNNTITYSLDDSAGGRFSINSSTGVVTVANSSLLNFESATSHSIIVRASSSDGSASTQSFTISLTDVDEFDVGSVSDANSSSNNVAENAANGTTVGVIASASDADGSNNTITYSLDNNAGGRFAINGSTGVITVANGTLLDRESNASHTVTVRATSSDGSFSTTNFTIQIDDVDEFDITSIDDTNAAANNLAENSANGSVVGITASASDADATNNTITYSLDNNAGGRFAINSTTGIVTVANGSLLNYESASSHTINVRATSADGSQTTRNFTISLSDINEFDISTITDTNAASNSVAENAANGTTVGITALASDADGTSNTITYSLDNSDGGRFAINGSTGIVSVANGALLDYEAATSHLITVRATSTDCSFSTQQFTINLTDVDEFDISSISDTNASINSIAENASNGSLVGITASASDVDGTNNTITYSLDNNAGGRFAINSTSGVVTVANGSLLNYEAATSHSITVRASSSDGSSSTQSYNITLTDVDEFDVSSASDTNPSDNAVLENAANGTNVGITASASDADATNNLISYSLADDAGGRFAIHSSTGVVTVANGSLLDREQAASHQITVRATSADGSTSNTVFTINLIDIDEFDIGAISDSNVSGNTVAENSANGSSVGITASATDLDATLSTITYSLEDSAGGRFAIHSATGVVTVANGTLLNYESATSHQITVRATSQDGSTTLQNFMIALSDVDEFDVGPISDLDPTSSVILENSAEGTLVGITARAVDADATTNTITYSLDNSAGGRFAIDASTGVVTVAVGATLDREQTANYGIVIRATSADGSHSISAFNIELTDIDEFDVTSVSDTNPAVNSVSENASTGTLVDGLSLFAIDQDATNSTITYLLDDSAGGRFSINSATGAVSVANGLLLNFESATSHQITVRAVSSDGSVSAQHTVTIQVLDIDEFDVGAVTDANLSVNAINENSANGTAVGITASAVDLDGSNSVITYSLDDNAAGRFTIDSSTGVILVANASLLDYESAITHSIVVRATSADGSSSTQAFTISLLDVDEFDASPISDLNPASEVLAENSIAGTLAGITARSIDSDGTTNAIVYSLDQSADGRFQIDAATGVVTVSGLVGLDFETANSHAITVRATSVDGSFSTASYTIQLTDVDEYDVGPISDINSAINRLAENSANGTGVGITARAVDADGTTNAIVYTLTDNAGGRFAIDSNSGAITVANGSLLNYENAISHIVSVLATSADGSFALQSFTIDIDDAGDVSEMSDADPAPNRLEENSVNGTVVGVTASAVDLDDSNGLVTYSLVDDAGGRFVIDSSTGVVRVANSTLLNYEVDVSHSITVRAQVSQRSYSLLTFTIAINDLDEFDVTVPTDTNPVPNNIDENVAIGSTVGITANAFDLDATTNSITYSLTSNPDGLFQIDPNTGDVTTAAAINREIVSASRNITVQASSTDGSTASQSFTITINDLDEFDVTVPTDDDATTNNVDENVAIGTTVGITANAFDLDATTSTITYSLTSNPDGLFQIDPNTGVVTTAAAIDREVVGASRMITVQASSTDGSTASQSFTITINDLDEFDITSITDDDIAPQSVLENSPFGTRVGITVHAFDGDATNSATTYSLDDNAGGRFAIDEVSGVVTVADSGGLDFEAQKSHSIVVRATSGDGSISTASFTVNVVGVNERPIAICEQYRADFVTPLTVSLAEMLANDTDPENDSLQIRILAFPSRGSISSLGNGVFVYQPESNFVGTVTILYTVSDGLLESLPQSAQIVIERPPAVIVAPPVDREIPKVVSVEQPVAPATVQTVVAPNELAPINRQVSAIILNESHDAIAIVREESMTAVPTNGSEVDLDDFTKSFTAGIDMELDWTLGNLSIETSSIQRLQLQIMVPKMIAHDQHSFERFVLPEERQSLEVQKREYFVQTATPIVVGTAIGAGISMHVLMTAHFGSSLLSQSGVFMPLDPLTILEGTAKVKKSKERLELLFEGASAKGNSSP